MKNTLCFSYQSEVLPCDSRLPDRAELFAKLRGLGLDPFVTLDGEAAFGADRVQVSGLDCQEVKTVQEVAFESIGLIVNRLNRSVKYEALPVDTLPPIVNENAVRRLVWNKDRVAEEVLEPLGLGIPTKLVSTRADIEAFLSQHFEQSFFLKPRHGNLGAGTRVLRRTALQKLYIQQPDLLDTQIVQPAYDFSAPFPKSIKPYDRKSAERFDELNTASLTKELRMYGFLSPGGLPTFPAARVVQPNRDRTRLDSEWFFVDPESVPDSLVRQTENVLARTAQLTGSLALLGAVDFGYGSTRKTTPPEWKIIELNGLSPGLISYAEHKTVADRLQTLLSQQLLATVESHYGKLDKNR